ncbi:MAG: 50S ribosomal protein L21 [Planctomycetota bacterium]
MYAVIQDRGKQYVVRPGDRLRVDLLPAEAGSEVVFDRVLLTGGDAGIAIGRPVVDGVAVRAKVVAERKEAKIVVFKKKRRKRMRRKQGHRQRMTEVEVVSIG